MSYRQASPSTLYTNVPQADVRVLIVETSPAPVPPIGNSPYERKQQTIWTNQQRNTQIARIATAVAQHDMKTLWQEGLFLQETTFPPTAVGRICVLVESPEHGLSIEMLLPGWPFEHTVPNWPNRCQDLYALSSFQTTITTLPAACAMDVFDPQVLIVAMGGDWIPEIPSYQQCERDYPALLIDFADDFDDQAREGTCSRVQAYRALGWDVKAAPRWNPFRQGTEANTRLRELALKRAQRPRSPAKEARQYLKELKSAT